MTHTTFTVNGRQVAHTGEDRTHLADFLREDMSLTGTHLGCEHGVCGACTLMKDGKPVRSCITYAAACDGADIRTVEDFIDDAVMIRLRAAFKANHALQCGFCTPGMLATAYDIVTRLPDADEARIREELSGNLCRCTGYMGIVAAIRSVLDDGPFDRPAAPVRAPMIGDIRPAATAAPSSPSIPPAQTSQSERPAPISGGTTLRQSSDLDLPLTQVWEILSDIPAVARCLPGATVNSVDPDGRVEGSYSIRIGPMKPRFGGTAFVTYDEAAHSGRVQGAGSDRSRSRAAGEIIFSLSETGAGTCRLDCDIVYKLDGPLAQVGRPAIVEGIVDQILSDFSANVSGFASGSQSAAQSTSMLGLIIAGFRNIFRRGRN